VQRSHEELPRLMVKQNILLYVMLSRKKFSSGIVSKILISNLWWKLASELERMSCWRLKQSIGNLVTSVFPTTSQVWRSPVHLLHYWTHTCPCSNQSNQKLQDWGITNFHLDSSNTSESLEDQASAVGLVVKKVQGSGSILATKSWFTWSTPFNQSFPLLYSLHRM
jgi:hypothetical protein